MAAISRHFETDCLEWKCMNFDKYLIEICSHGPINNIPAFLQIMASRLIDARPLSEPMMDSLPSHISWGILRSWLIEYSPRDNSGDLPSGIPARSGILLSDMMQFVNFNMPPDPNNIIRFEWFVYRMKATLGHIYVCWTANMYWRTCVVVKQIQSNPNSASIN